MVDMIGLALMHVSPLQFPTSVLLLAEGNIELIVLSGWAALWCVYAEKRRSNCWVQRDMPGPISVY
jgi:hypothetical protein